MESPPPTSPNWAGRLAGAGLAHKGVIMGGPRSFIPGVSGRAPLTRFCLAARKATLRRRSDTPTRATARAQGTDREPPKLAHVRQPMTEVINPAWGFLARSKRGTRPMPAWLFGGSETKKKVLPF